ncbi:hypothetical protein HWD95_25380, partial [Pseudomonas corrugata]|nr:hypothetical protein [Pseudomonas corrugata]
HALIAPHLGHHLDLSYVVRRGHSVRRAESLSLHIGPLVRPPLKAPRILGLKEGELDVDEQEKGVKVIIETGGFEIGELVWLQCDGSYAYVEEREIVPASVGQPMTFVVPADYWQSQQGRSVRVRYQVERLDDVSQPFAGVEVHVRSRSALPKEGAHEAQLADSN